MTSGVVSCAPPRVAVELPAVGPVDGRWTATTLAGAAWSSPGVWLQVEFEADGAWSRPAVTAFRLRDRFGLESTSAGPTVWVRA